MKQAPVLLVTGASSGIGAATAQLFGRRGYRLALVARRMERLQALADEIAAGGGEALPVRADLSRLEDIQAAVGATLEHFGQIDVLFNNAGFGRLSWLENLDPIEDVQEQIDVNLTGLIQTTQAVLPHMIARHSGHIINMSSVAGWMATPTYSVYAASKFGIRGFTEALRREVGVYGVRVSGIYPGGTRTEFAQQARIERKTQKTTPAFLRLEAEEVARGVWSLVQRPRRALVMPWLFWMAIWVNRVFPALMDWAVEARFVRPERTGS